MKLIKCPLCGFEFSRNEMKEGTCAKCPFHKKCSLICCPHCNYQFVDESKVVSYLKDKLGKAAKKGAGND